MFQPQRLRAQRSAGAYELPDVLDLVSVSLGRKPPHLGSYSLSRSKEDPVEPERSLNRTGG